MMTHEDMNTVQYALSKRLGEIPGVEALEVKTKYHAHDQPPFIAVGVEFLVDKMLVGISVFDLPVPFEHGHMMNELDQIAEQIKAIRRDAGHLAPQTREVANIGSRPIVGTGRRGLWPR